MRDSPRLSRGFPRIIEKLLLVSVPGERWEIEFLEDGQVEVEIFQSDGQILDKDALSKLLSSD